MTTAATAASATGTRLRRRSAVARSCGDRTADPDVVERLAVGRAEAARGVGATRLVMVGRLVSEARLVMVGRLAGVVAFAGATRFDAGRIRAGATAVECFLGAADRVGAGPVDTRRVRLGVVVRPAGRDGDATLRLGFVLAWSRPLTGRSSKRTGPPRP